jgi:hypothetical protein
MPDETLDEGSDVKEKKIVFLSNPESGPEPRFVSLVRYGANGTPFNIVKNEKSKNLEDTMPMKVLQSVVTMSGVTADVVKAAFNEEVRDAVNLSAPKASGSFTAYEQVPRDSFKSESLEVVSLNDDNSIFGIQGELVEQPAGIVSKLFKKPAQKSEFIGMSDTDVAVSVDVLKSKLGSALWEERDALNELIRGVLGQEHGDVTQKIAVIRQGMDNFLASIQTALETFKCEKLVLTEPQKETEKKEQEPPATKVPATDNQVNPSEKQVVEPKVEDTEKKETPAQEAPVQDVKSPDAAALVTEAVSKSEASMKALIDAKMLDVSKSFQESLKTFQEEISKTLKTPGSVVRTHNDDPVLDVQKKEKGSDANIFKGCLGHISTHHK